MKRKKLKFRKINLIFLLPIIMTAIIVSISGFTVISKGGIVTKTPTNTSESPNSTDEATVSKTIKVYFHEEDKARDVDLEEYLLGVIPAEMPPSFNDEALKAQAVAARTYIINRERANNKESLEKHKGGVICTDYRHCKAYISEEKLKERLAGEWENNYKNKIQNIISSTKGEIITYNSEPISAVFHSTSSGKTENSEDVWGNSLPYLKSVSSEGEDKSPRFVSNAEFSFEDFKSNLKKINANVKFDGDVNKWIEKIDRNESGSVKTIRIGGVDFKGTDIRTAFSLRSTNFDIKYEKNVVFHVKGNGHGVGMSQYGANYAAESGLKYKEILKKYYQGVSIDKIY